MAVANEFAIDWGASGTFDANGTVDALLAYTIDELAAFTIDDLGTISTPEDVTLEMLIAQGVAAERGRNLITEQMPPLANEVSCTLDNTSGDYHPTNAGSPLYPNVVTGRRMRWRLLVSGTPYPVIDGALTEIAPYPETARQSVGLVALSQLSRLVKKTGYSSPVYGDGTLAGGVRSDVALGYVFAAAGLTDPALFDLDAGDTVLLYFCIRPGDELFALAEQIVVSEGAGARLWDAADGRTSYRRRTAEGVLARSTTVQETYYWADNGSDPWFKGWAPSPADKHVVNQCSFPIVRRAVDAADAAFWAFGADITLGASEARPFQIQPSSDHLVASVVAPAVGTDYTVTAGGVASIVFNRTSGPFVTMTVTATGAGATIRGPTGTPADGLTVRGKLLRVVTTTQITSTVDASASVVAHGPHPLPRSPLPDLDPLVAQSLADGAVQRDMLPRAVRTIDVLLDTDAQAAATLALDVGDRIAVIYDPALFAEQMWVESIRVTEPPGGGPAHAFLGCQSIRETDYLIWDAGTGWDSGIWSV